ncbi:MAG: hypothetical protein ACOYKN_12395 [Pirellula sp.]
MDNKLTFLLSRRSKIFDGATPEGGRLRGSVEMTMHDVNGNQKREIQIPEFYFPGPKDIDGFKPGTVRKMCPHPGASDAEITKLVHVDLNDPGLPWRYSPQNTPPIHPWIVLVVGKASEFKDAKGKILPPSATILKEHKLSESHRWAHVQLSDGKTDDGSLDDLQVADGREISRLVSPASLEPFQSYVAAIVPAFTPEGQDLWGGDGILKAVCPIYHHWEFSTGAPGDFESLVNLLRLRQTGNVGVVDLQYRQEDIHLQLRGAITTLDADEQLDMLPPEKKEKLHTDLRALDQRVLEIDRHDGSPQRTIIGLPQYGYPWVDDPQSVAQAAENPVSPWVRSLNDDPRYRAIAGMGTWLGIAAQEELMSAATEQAGALHDAASLIRQAALGVELSSRLWQRRLPEDPAQRLQVFGPAMTRLSAGPSGSVLSQVTGRNPATGRESTLCASQFSSAAMRMLRNGTSRNRHSMTPGSIDRKALLEEAAKPPEKPRQDPDGVPNVGQVLKPDAFGSPLKPTVLDVIAKFAGSPLKDAVINEFTVELQVAGLDPDQASCVNRSLESLKNQQGISVASADILRLVVGTCFRSQGQDFDLGVLVACTPPEPPDRFSPIPIGALSDAVSQAIDPTKADSPTRIRIQDTIGNLPIGNLAQPELPLGLDFCTWQLVKKYAPDWLLPGVSTIPENSIVSLQTNPTFIDAFLTGINSQFLAEARWRNLWIQRRFTPLRMFWGHIDPKTGKRMADVQPISEWAQPDALQKDLGDKSHQVIDPRDAAGKNDLVILFRTELFRRYPGTLVYLAQPKPGLRPDELESFLKETPDFSAPVDPDQNRFVGPIFTGNLTPDIVFFAFDIDPQTLDKCWLVLDEPPAELRFLQATFPFRDTLVFDDKSIDRHTRVAVSGLYLEKMGGGT